MTDIVGLAVGRLKSFIEEEGGINSEVAAIAAATGADLALLGSDQIRDYNVSADFSERGPLSYPQLHVYCERLANKQREKFSTFSGTVRVALEIRVSQDRIEGLERQLQTYTAAICNVLDIHRGDWGCGLFFSGGYEVNYAAPKRGGKAFVQASKVTVELDGSFI